MCNNLIIKVKSYLNSMSLDNIDDPSPITVSAKLQKIINNAKCCDTGLREEIETTINSFIAGSEIQKNKLLSYCFGFYDPTEHNSNIQVDREEVINHSFLKQDEFDMLYRFVKKHQEDKTFGDVVYMIIDNHGMTAPQVYKNALLRRQDWGRVTDPRCKNVSRKMAWQIIIGLHCSLQEADEVLFSAGYIRRKNRFDLTMQYFIEHKNYDIEAIDAVLSELKLKTFTCE